MTDRIADSVLYRHLWGTDEARAVLGEEGRLAGWLEVITALARVQAEAGLIPAAAAFCWARRSARSVAVKPGEIALIRILCRARSLETPRVKLINAAFVVLPGRKVGPGVRPAAPIMLTIRPSRRSIM